MSDKLATYAFLPWLRRGMASEIGRRDGTMTGAARAEVPITVLLRADGAPRNVTVPLALYGPGDVASIDPRVVIRSVPKPDEIDAEPNYFASIEFDQADFPWRYTAATADASFRLRPWLVLAVVRADEIKEEAPPGATRLAAVTVASASALPRLAQSWAWAHSQIEGFDGAAETIAGIVQGQPRRARSRLLAPRRLSPNTAYRALLVPAFERGRRAGLDETLDNGIDALTPAWSDGDIDIRLPVYYEWRFQTGVKGDFETLARRLSARAVDDSVGRMDMDVRTPDPALPAAATMPLAYEGALVSPRMAGTTWAPAERGPFISALAAMTNQAAENIVTTGGETILAPPLWGRWHAARDRLDITATAWPAWFHELNSDPRHRVAAGLGAEIVRQQDQQLMAAAWDQVEGVVEANAELRQAQLAREAAAKLHHRHYGQLDRDSFLAVTYPLHTRFRASPRTIREVIRRSPMPNGALDGTMRRVLRRQGAIARRMRRAAAGTSQGLLDRLNSGSLRARPAVPTPRGMLSTERIAREPPSGTYPDWLPAALLALAILLLLAALLLGFAGNLLLAAASFLAAGAALLAAGRVRRERQRRQDAQAVLDGHITAEAVRRAQPSWDFVPAISTADSAHRPLPAAAAAPASGAAREAIAALRGAFSDLAGELNVPARPGQVLVPADLSEISRTLFAKMDPRLTIPAAITHRLQIADWVTWTYQDPLEPVMVAPEFDTPMYEPLRDHGQIWLMPGVGTIPPDTVTLVASNQRFIEAYMAGLSHEMARELLYHEYPTDQRGTYFRQFWDVRAAMAPGGAAPDPENLKDIKRIHEWLRDRALGNNSGRNPALAPGNLVFLIKGEVLRRYPDTLVYAVRTIIKDGERTLGDAQKMPLFEGRLHPDISFFGFDLLAEQVRGHDDPAQDQGWYFMLQEQPTEPLFGLDADDGRYGAAPRSWLDLNWANLASDADALEGLGYIDLDADLPDTSLVAAQPGDPAVAWHASRGRGPAGANGSDLAHITLQRPFRVAIHGSDMLGGGAP